MRAKTILTMSFFFFFTMSFFVCLFYLFWITIVVDNWYFMATKKKKILGETAMVRGLQVCLLTRKLESQILPVSF